MITITCEGISMDFQGIFIIIKRSFKVFQVVSWFSRYFHGFQSIFHDWEHPKIYPPNYILAPLSHPLGLGARRAALVYWWWWWWRWWWWWSNLVNKPQGIMGDRSAMESIPSCLGYLLLRMMTMRIMVTTKMTIVMIFASRLRRRKEQGRWWQCWWQRWWWQWWWWQWWSWWWWCYGKADDHGNGFPGHCCPMIDGRSWENLRQTLHNTQ